VPVEVRELLEAIADAIVDTGPLELGVRPRDWERACAAALRTVECLDSAAPDRASRVTRRLLRTLTRRVRKLGRATEAPPKAVQALAIPDRKLLACLLVSAPKQLGGEPFFASLRGLRRVVLVTDRRLVVLKTARWRVAASVEWEAFYGEVAEYSSVYRAGGENSPAQRRVTLGIGGEAWTLTVGERDGEAFLRILRRRIPEGDRDRTRRPRPPYWRAFRIAAALFTGVVIALALTHGHHGDSSAGDSVASLLAPAPGAECFDVLAKRVGCDSTETNFEALPCSEVSETDRQLTNMVDSNLPELKALVRRLEALGSCVKMAASPASLTGTP
jgi:hypothetical protein